MMLDPETVNTVFTVKNEIGCHYTVIFCYIYMSPWLCLSSTRCHVDQYLNCEIACNPHVHHS